MLDFGVGAVGVEVGRFFAEYGADVVKVESATAPDFIRTITPEGMNPAFASSSRSKRGLGVNLKDARGLALVRKLARLADVVVENNGAGVMDRLGLGYESLRAENPRLVYFSSNLTGSRGPWSAWIGYGPSTHPVSGMQHLWNFPEDEARPAGSTNVYPDHFVGRLGALAAVAGLFQRERSGVGYHAEAAQFEGAIGFIGDWLARESLAPGTVHPRGNASERGAPWGAYPCEGEDEWCAICVRSDAEWRALREELGSPAWAARAELDDRARAAGGARRARPTPFGVDARADAARGHAPAPGARDAGRGAAPPGARDRRSAPAGARLPADVRAAAARSTSRRRVRRFAAAICPLRSREPRRCSASTRARSAASGSASATRRSTR